MSLQVRLQSTLGDGYTLERELAGGGMSRVFLARDLALERLVVIKTLASDVAPAVSTERFRREIRLAASLQQANIVPVHSTGEVDGVPYYTMPFVEGESVRARLDKAGALSVREAVGILRDVARALAFAHERGVVHRDIKPENILLSGDTAVVTDFGIAKAIEASQSHDVSPTLTHLGTVLGTPAYMSPEQAAGGTDIDHRADIYSLGIVAYELLTGKPPFVEKTAQALMAAHILSTPVPLQEKRRDVPARLAVLVLRCLEKDPDRRPANAGELLRALDQSMEDDAGVAAAVSPRKPSVAVLPFVNLSPDPADEYFADGLTDEIITDLAAIHALRVIARGSVMRFKGSTRDIAAAAAELNARYVLDGSVRRAGTSLRLTAQLVDISTGDALWTDKLGGQVEDVFAMQERVSRTIVDALRIALTPREDAHLRSRPIRDLVAYESYLQARQSMYTFTVPSLDRAMKLLEAAEARIGENARLATALGGVHLNYVETGQVDREYHLAAAERYVERVARLDADSCGYQLLRGWLHWKRGHIQEAIASLSRAHELEPSSSDAAIYLSLAHLYAGHDDQAARLARIVVELDPLTPLFQCMPGFCDVMAGRAADGLPAYRRFPEMDPANPVAHTFLVWALAEAGEWSEAAERGDRVASEFPDTMFGKFGKCYAHAIRGESAAGLAVVNAELRAQCRHNESACRMLASVCTLLGAHDLAIDALEDAVALGLTHYPYLARNATILGRLRGHPRFVQLLETVRRRWERGGASAADATPRAPAGTTPAKHAERKSVAVLPFANLSPDPENEFFADGITDDLISQVAKIGSLRVISRTSVIRYRSANVPARQAATELGVTAVVEGTVRRAGSRVRVVAQLLDAASDEATWSETYDRTLDDVFAVQTDVARNIARALEASLTPAEERRLEKRSTTDARAYDLYLLGRSHYNRRTPESLRAAMSHFEQAIVRDPDFAAAHAGLADAYVFAGIGYAPIPPVEAFARAREAANRALALDDASPEAHCASGLAAMHGDWDVPRAQTSFERAIAVNPNHAPAFQFLGWCRFSVGDYVGAVEPLRRALELDPLNVSLIAEVGWPYSYAGLNDIAIVQYQRAIELDPGFGLGHYNFGLALHAMGKRAEAVACYERAIACMGPSPWVLTYLANVNNELGNRAKAEEILAGLREQARSGIAVWLSIGMVLDGLGRTDEALDALERSVAEREPFIWAIGIENWLQLPHARSHPRFAALMNTLGAKPHDIPRQRELLLGHVNSASGASSAASRPAT